METKIALVTGASSGIGKATASLLARQGYNLILMARRAERLLELSEFLTSQFKVECCTLITDVRNKQEVFNAINNLPQNWKNIWVLINNAGLASGLSAIDDGDTEDWEVMIDTNLKGLLYVTKAVVPFLKAHPYSHIINVGSIAGKEVYANGNVYCATKHGVDALSKAMRIEFAKYPIKVTAIHPGAVETEFSVVRFKGDKDKAAAVYKGFDNLLAEDIANAIGYCISTPKHVNINELVIMPTAQPVASIIHRNATD